MIRILLLILLGCRLVTAQGTGAVWPTAAKNGFGTSNTLASKVWFTLADGVMTEVFYPTVDMPSVRSFQFLIITGAQTENETEDTVHTLELPNPASLTFRQINRAKSGAYTITKTYIADPQRSSVLIRVDFTTTINAQLYINDVALNDKSVVMSSCGLPKLERRQQCTLALGFGETIPKATATARASLARGFAAVMRDYELGWHKYVATLPRVEKH